MIKNAMHAMRLGSKVSVRLCPAGVMSMQFMIEMDGGDASFVDFRFLPLVEGGVEGQEE